MIQQLIKRFAFRSIRLKLFIGFGVLIFLVILEISVSVSMANRERTARERVDDAQNEVVQVKNLQTAMLLARQAEYQSFADLMLVGYEASYQSYADVLDYVQQSRLIMDDLVAADVQTPAPDSTGEVLSPLQVIDQGIKDYENMVIDLVTVKTVERGTLETGMAGEFMANLRAIQAHTDIAQLLEQSTGYIETFNTDFTIVVQIPTELNQLKETVQAGDFDADTKAEILGQISAARRNFIALTANDVSIVTQINTMTDLLIDLNEQIDLYVQDRLVEQDNAKADFEAIHQTSQNVTSAVRILLVATALIFAYATGRSITLPINTLDRAAQRFAVGQYDQPVTVESRDEIGKLADTLNSMARAVNQREQELRDIAENLRIASEQAQVAERVKSEFLATMSHELRTPLNAIIGFADLLAYGMVGELTELQREKLDRLQNNAKRLVVLINDVLDLSRIEAGRIQLKIYPFSPAEMARRIRNQIMVLAEQKNLDFEVTLDPNLPEVIPGDEKRIEQVVVNLLGNAIKFTDEGQVRLYLTSNQPFTHWQIQVQDTGIGIAPHAKEYIFDAFRQVDGSSTRKHQGTGLGLAIVEKLVRLMDGQVQVESELGQGSTFTVTLPLEMSEDADNASEPGKVEDAVG